MGTADQMLPPAPPTRNSALTSPLAAHSTDVLPMGTDAGPAAAQGCFITWHSFREGVAGKGELSRQQRPLACPAEQK